MGSRIAVLGLGVGAIACCAGLPTIAAALGGLTAGALIGVAAGLISAVVLGVAALLFARVRRQRARAREGR